MENSKIEWTDHSFNPWYGCTKVSEACKNCYAEAFMDKRLGAVKWGFGQPRKKGSERSWKNPRVWNNQAGKEGVRRKVFCASLADVFDEEAPEEWRTELFDLIDATRNLDWLLLTKRPREAWRYYFKIRAFPPNVWIGTTAENQLRLSERAFWLTRIPATVRFLSCEPLLGPLDLTDTRNGNLLKECERCAGGGREPNIDPTAQAPCKQCGGHGTIDWVIVGGESGHAARPPDPGWIRSIRNQCVAHDRPFFFKQWGDFAPVWEGNDVARHANGKARFKRVGKRAAGNELDGQTWEQTPDVEYDRRICTR